MIQRQLWIQFLRIMNESLEKSLRLPDDNQWQSSLVQAGFQDENLDAASYVIAAIFDYKNRETFCILDTSGQDSWSWKLFQDATVGVNYFHRLESAINQMNECWIWYWIGIHTGFRGQWIDDESSFQQWCKHLDLPSFPIIENIHVVNVNQKKSLWKVIFSVSLLMFSFVYYIKAMEMTNG